MSAAPMPPAAAGDWWWWPAGSDPGDRPVLFFPPAGAEQNIVGPLLEHAAGLRLGVLRLPGRGVRQHEPPPHELAPLVASITNAIVALRGPAPILVGHSFGGLLAFAVAAEIEARGYRVARLITLASACPASWTRELEAERTAYPDGGRAGFVARRTARVLAHGGVPARIAGHAEYGERVRTMVGVDLGLSYAGFGTAQLRCPITAIRARDDPMLSGPSVTGWAAATSAECESVTVPGDHFFYRDRPRELVVRMRLEMMSA